MSATKPTDPRFTTHNSNNTTTCGNHRLIVTLPTDIFEKLGRQGVFDRAMQKIGNDNEAKLLTDETIDDDDIKKLAHEIAMHRHLTEHCRYNINETMMRYYGHHRMSQGMAADVQVAELHAINNVTNDDTKQAHEILERDHAHELRYRQRTETWCQGWNIEIIGEMPDQIGLCRC